ncbi:protein phosphatase methylesterase [Rhizoclosmatium globosum]|uniref:Protein phosphatase methylesterase 1 n=1 Tax=Rhizoclosmatium globosum TaxID=329046 RepID=A0A1Y2CNS0_9FUNG|nr:protein phosphatase methylesterase [Rhizoclosmatium globosum]|eukprot:ORY48596.1 protein phosphatase methylesterase [Rhizoclosmatium globosum]
MASNATQTEQTIEADGDQFRVYTWTTGSGVGKAPLVVLHHGAGSSALTFGLAGGHVACLLSDESAVVVAFDARGHGATVTANADESLALDTLSNDLARVVAKVRRDNDQEVVLVGHSMGGSVVVDACSKSLIPNVVGVAVVDVVEGTAMESLTHMQSILKSRPSMFRSTDDAIKWSLRNHHVQNKESAKISIPPLFTQRDTNVFTWRTDLAASEPHWQTWFQGLSAKFLGLKCGRLLLLAGADRLDKELMIGQMQGKFQVVVFPESWHYVQEDVPDKFAASVADFWRRNQKLVVIKRFPIPLKTTTSTSSGSSAVTEPVIPP